VEKNDNGSIRGAGLSVAHIQQAGIDLLQWSERRICSWLDCRHFCLRPLCRRWIDHAKLSGGDSHRRGAKEKATILVGFVHSLHCSTP
jgi:hypothetical protein